MISFLDDKFYMYQQGKILYNILWKYANHLLLKKYFEMGKQDLCFKHKSPLNIIIIIFFIK